MEEIIGILLRISFTYLYLLFLVRVTGKRVVGDLTPFDFIVTLTIGDIPDDLIWGEIPVAAGITAMSTLIVLHLLVVYGSFRSIPFDRLVGSGPSDLLRDGQPVRATMARERVGEWSIDGLLREKRVAERSRVKHLTLEPNGLPGLILRDVNQPLEKRDLPAREEVSG